MAGSTDFLDQPRKCSQEALPEGGCNDVIAPGFGIAGSLRHRDELLILRGTKLQICRGPLIYDYHIWLSSLLTLVRRSPEHSLKA